MKDPRHRVVIGPDRDRELGTNSFLLDTSLAAFFSFCFCFSFLFLAAQRQRMSGGREEERGEEEGGEWADEGDARRSILRKKRDARLFQRLRSPISPLARFPRGDATVAANVESEARKRTAAASSTADISTPVENERERVVVVVSSQVEAGPPEGNVNSA